MNRDLVTSRDSFAIMPVSSEHKTYRKGRTEGVILSWKSLNVMLLSSSYQNLLSNKCIDIWESAVYQRLYIPSSEPDVGSSGSMMCRMWGPRTRDVAAPCDSQSHIL